MIDIETKLEGIAAKGTRVAIRKVIDCDEFLNAPAVDITGISTGELTIDRIIFATDANWANCVQTRMYIMKDGNQYGMANVLDYNPAGPQFVASQTFDSDNVLNAFAPPFGIEGGSIEAGQKLQIRGNNPAGGTEVGSAQLIIILTRVTDGAMITEA